MTLLLGSFLLPVDAWATIDDKQVELSMRAIGHEFLQSSGDSTSRVLPVQKNENVYRLQFESDFSFLPDDLVRITNKLLLDRGIAESYLAEVIQCDSGELVYAFQTSPHEDMNLAPCQSRLMDLDCYELIFTLNPKLEDDSKNDVAMLQAGTQDDDKALWWRYGGAVVLLIVLLLLLYRSRERRSVLESKPGLIPLGDYYYDKINTELIYRDDRIELTGKEAELLQVLYASPNETIDRATILHKVWGDEGDYIGRTLDVFISRLRKKLDADSRLKIVNVRGVGYRFVMDT